MCGKQCALSRRNRQMILALFCTERNQFSRRQGLKKFFLGQIPDLRSPHHIHYVLIRQDPWCPQPHFPWVPLWDPSVWGKVQHFAWVFRLLLGTSAETSVGHSSMPCLPSRVQPWGCPHVASLSWKNPHIPLSALPLPACSLSLPCHHALISPQCACSQTHTCVHSHSRPLCTKIKIKESKRHQCWGSQLSMFVITTFLSQ